MKELKSIILFCLLVLIPCSLEAQDVVGFVDPFIGTDKSDIKTIWGQYGGTYPGAVAPWGAVQLSPETRRTGERGYFYSDSTICYFTCVNHSSGYPEGSHGNIQITFSIDTSEDVNTSTDANTGTGVSTGNISDGVSPVNTGTDANAGALNAADDVDVTAVFRQTSQPFSHANEQIGRAHV